MATRFANAVPVLDGGHRVIQMLQHMGSVKSKELSAYFSIVVASQSSLSW
jgi:hypothetical protein